MTATLYEQHADALLTRGHRCIPHGERAPQIASALGSAGALALRLPANPQGRERPLGDLITVLPVHAGKIVNDVSDGTFYGASDYLGPVCDIEVNIMLSDLPAAQEVFPELRELQPVVDQNFEVLAGTFEEMNKGFGVVGQPLERASMIRIHHNPVIARDELPEQIIRAIADLRLGSVRMCLAQRLHCHSDRSYASTNDQNQPGVQHQTPDGWFHNFPIDATSMFHGNYFADKAGIKTKDHRVYVPHLMIGRAREPMPPGRTSLTCFYNPFA